MSKVSLFKRIIGSLVLCAFLGGCPLLLIGGTSGIAMLVHERRSTGTLADDKEIQIKLYRYFKKYLPNSSNLVVATYNRRVLLAGEVPNGQTKIYAEQHAKKILNVREIINEIEIHPPRSSKQRTKDTLTTGKIKTSLIQNKIALLNHIKVVTIHDVVYLMGIVTYKEGATAIEIARHINTVKKVVQLFEYIK